MAAESIEGSITILQNMRDNLKWIKEHIADPIDQTLADEMYSKISDLHDGALKYRKRINTVEQRNTNAQSAGRLVSQMNFYLLDKKIPETTEIDETGLQEYIDALNEAIKDARMAKGGRSRRRSKRVRKTVRARRLRK